MDDGAALPLPVSGAERPRPTRRRTAGLAGQLRTSGPAVVRAGIAGARAGIAGAGGRWLSCERSGTVSVMVRWLSCERSGTVRVRVRCFWCEGPVPLVRQVGTAGEGLDVVVEPWRRLAGELAGGQEPPARGSGISVANGQPDPAHGSAATRQPDPPHGPAATSQPDPPHGSA